jgi:parallel beta-helix repeat protein
MFQFRIMVSKFWASTWIFRSQRSRVKTFLAGLAFSLATLFAAQAQAHTYYVSSIGNDDNTGRSKKSAWKTVVRVNRDAFQAGDSILFNAGGVWNGQLHPLGSGAPGKPIRIDRYGDGAMPVINFGEATGGGLKLTNQEWWVIQNIEVTSGAPPRPGAGRQGIVALADGPNGHTGHLVISNCYVHDIWGQLGGSGDFTGYNSSAIYAGPALGNRNAPRDGADDVLIVNNRIERVDRCGIILSRARDNIVVRGNQMENLGGDGIFVNGCRRGLLEHNIAKRTCMRSGDPDLVIVGRPYNPHTAAMWLQNCFETVMQFNEVYDTGRQKGNGDGNAYDFDFDCTNCLVQYNYSRNNHGFLLIMNRAVANTARYNISENDQTHLIQTHGTLSERNLVCNNVFYVDYGTIDMDYYMGDQEVSDDVKSQLGANFRNNIFYATGQGRFRNVYTFGSALERKYLDSVKLPHPAPGTLFEHNWYFGPWLNGLPDDPEARQGDPMFVAPGTGGVGLATLAGYKLRPGSPCVDTGMPIAGNGGRDFFGNPLATGAVSYGVDEKPDATSATRPK